jgi:integrase/recombinase XerD
MTARVVTFKVEEESPLGARARLRALPGGLSPDDPLAPVTLYLERLAASGSRTQRINLVRAARILSGERDAGLDYRWADLTSGHLEFLIGALRGQGLSPSVINSTVSAIRRVARWAWHFGQMPHEQYERLCDVPGVPARRDSRRRAARALAVSEIDALFKSCEREQGLCAVRDACMIALLYAGGLRREEACSVTLANYSRRTHQLTVKGKGGHSRSVHFRDGGARRAIHAWLRVRGCQAGPLLYAVNRHDQVAHPSLSPTGLYRALQRRARKAGVEPFTAHDLRRSLGAHLRKRVDLEVVRAVLGHTDIRVTQVYLMVEEEEKREAMLKVRVSFRVRRKRGRRKKKRRHRR